MSVTVTTKTIGLCGIAVTAFSLGASDAPASNERCERQLPDIGRTSNLPMNGHSSYNPWLRSCSYKYYKDGEVQILRWMPDFK